jgi:hypothetical protein
VVRSDHSWREAQQLLLQLMVDSGYMADGQYGLNVREGLNRDKRTDKGIIKKCVVLRFPPRPSACHVGPPNVRRTPTL